MNYEELIQDFLDGTLDPSGERDLLSAVAGDDALRSELKRHMAIQRAVRSDTQAFVPSAKSTGSIFSSLGYAVPGGVAAEAARRGLFAKIGAFVAKYYQGLIGGLTATVATLVVVLLLLEFFGSGDTYKSNQSESEKTAAIIGSENHNPTQHTAGSDLLKEGSPSTGASEVREPQVIYKTKYVYLPVKIDTSKIIEEVLGKLATKFSDDTPMNESNDGRSNVFGRVSPSIGDYIASNQNRFTLREPAPTPIFDLTPRRRTEIESDRRFALAIRASQPFYATPIEVSPENNQIFNNYGIAFSYAPTDYLAVGADLRRENFYQIYETGPDGSGYYWRHEQQPNFTSAGLFVRGIWSDALPGFSPYAQFGFGGNVGGYALRPAIGLVYSPYPGISFILDVEYNNFRFTQDGEGFNSEKTNLNYGISFDF